MGIDRATAAVRATWAEPHVLTSFELQVGLVGDPYVVRGIVETMVRM
jgi:hypothetical protein